MKRFNTWLIVIACMTLIGAGSVAATTLGTSGVGGFERDEILIVLPADRVDEAGRAIPGIRFYHRFPEFFLAGATRKVAAALESRGVAYQLIDQDPWSQPYAVVASAAGGPTQRDYLHLPLRVIFRSADFDIVKGQKSIFRSLKEHGYSWVEIDQVEIDPRRTATHLPESFVTRNDPTITTILGFVSDSVVTGYIQGLQNFGTRYCMNPNRDSVFSWVRHRFLEAGITDVALDSFQYNGTWQKNVVATIPGTLNPSAEIIVGGHLDSYSSNLSLAPGADDNATGTAAAIEMARAIVLSGYQPNLTLRFIGFAAEEVGLRGSASYAQRARAQNRDIKVMMNYDMIGYRNQSQPARDVYVVWYPGSEAFSNLHAAMATRYGNLTPVFTSSYRSSSDSWSFFQQNYNTVFLIERNFNPYYHSPNDLLQYLDIPYARDIIKSGLAMVLTLDQLPPSVPGLQVLDRGNGTSLVVRWDSVAVQDFYRYKISVGTAPGSYTSSYLQTTRQRTLTGLTEGVEYFVGVSIVDLAGNEGVIVEQSATPRSIPLPPSGLVAEGSDDSVFLTWRRNMEMDLHGYYLYRAVETDTGFARLNAIPLIDTSWTDGPLPAATYYYYVTAVDSSGNESAPSDTVEATTTLVGVGTFAGEVPQQSELLQNYPNPFNPATRFEMRIARFGLVTLKVYNILGQEVATLVHEELHPGIHEVTWDAGGMASGVYQCVLRTGSVVQSIRVVLVR